MRLNKYIILFVIVLLGFFLRVYNLQTVPFGFQGDEVDAGYEGKYIIDNGKDTYGNSYPLYFNRFGDYRPTGIFYLAGISEHIFGVNEFAVRFPSALFGTLSIILVFLIAQILFKKDIVSLLSSFFLSVNLWHYNLSRATSESIIASFFILLGIYCFLICLNSKKNKYIIYGSVAFLLSFFFYHTARVLAPVILIYFLGVTFFKDRKSFLRIYLPYSLLLCLVALIFIVKVGGRAAQVSVFNVPGINNSLDYLISGDGGTSPIITRVFHNKGILLARLVLEQYLSYFSGVFLFIKGGLPQRYQVPEVGLLPITQMLFIVAGLFALIKKHKFKIESSSTFLLYVLLIAPIPAAFTWEDVPNLQRSSFLIFPLILLSGYGCYELVTFFRKQWRLLIIFIMFIIFSFEVIYGFHQYFVHFSQYRSYARDDGTRELMTYISSNKNQYDSVFLSRNINPLFYLFFTNNFSKNLVLPFDKEPSEITFGNIHFIKYPNIINECIGNWLMKTDLIESHKKLLLIDSGTCMDSQEADYPFTLEKRIMRKDQTKAFTIYSFNK